MHIPSLRASARPKPLSCLPLLLDDLDVSEQSCNGSGHSGNTNALTLQCREPSYFTPPSILPAPQPSHTGLDHWKLSKCLSHESVLFLTDYDVQLVGRDDDDSGRPLSSSPTAAPSNNESAFLPSSPPPLSPQVLKHEWTNNRAGRRAGSKQQKS